MLDLTAQQSSEQGHLASVKILRDGSASGALVYDVNLSFTVTDDADADAVDRALRGAKAYYEAVKDTEAKGAINLSPSEVTGRLVLVHADDAVTVADASAEIRRLQMAKAAKVTIYTVRARIRGLDESAAAHFAKYLDKRLTVQWEVHNAQMSLPFASPAPSNAVQVVTAEDGQGSYVFGIQTGIDGDDILLDDFGTVLTVAASSVTSRVTLAPEHGTAGPPLTDVVAPYAEQMKAQGATPSWQYIILGMAQNRGTDLESAVYRVTQADLEAAVRAAASDVAS